MYASSAVKRSSGTPSTSGTSTSTRPATTASATAMTTGLDTLVVALAASGARNLAGDPGGAGTVAAVRILHVGDDHAALRPCGLTLYSDALMRAQAAAGHEVSYVFSGRYYPRLHRPRLKRWRSGPLR